MVKKQVFYMVIISIFLLIGSVLFKQTLSDPTSGQVIFLEQDLIFQVETAKTEKQRTQGLMRRPFLAQDTGMLFVFEREEKQRVWMKKTLIGLDVVFMSEAGEVVSILQGLKPCVQTPCEIYHSNKKAKYMLEVSAGTFEKTGVIVGQQVIFDRL